jgi:serine/threonine-protein kinase
MSRGFRYRVLRKIAHGGMAEIFTALQVGAEGFEKPVVLKRILPALAADPAFVRMLVDEAHIASSLIHSNLVQVLDLGKVDDQFFLALEFVDGWSLEQIRKRARKARVKLPLPLALHITASLCRALDYVHRRNRNGKPLGIVHRDVTPQNVLVSREGEVKLADFGIAKASGRREKSATGVIKGKFAYMSPEQSIGAELDARSDLFSVGTLLYVLTTGKKPFEASSDLDVLMQVRRARFEKPSSFVRDYNADVERFIVRALRADRARRWQSAEQMADRLDAIMVKLGQPSGPAALKRWLESLSARDGALPPSELHDTPDEVPEGTMQIESRELELQEVGKPEDPLDDDDDDELATAPVMARARTRVATLGDALNAAAKQDPPLTAVARAARKLAAAAARDADAAPVPSVAEPAGGAELTMSASPDYAVAMTWTGVPLSLVTPSRGEREPNEEELARDANYDDTIDMAMEPDGEASATTAFRSSRPDAPAAQVETARDVVPALSRSSRIARGLKRAAIGGVLFPALLMGGLYAARPILPAWLAPPELVAAVDDWLKQIPLRLEALEGRSTDPANEQDAPSP